MGVEGGKDGEVRESVFKKFFVFKGSFEGLVLVVNLSLFGLFVGGLEVFWVCFIFVFSF